VALFDAKTPRDYTRTGVRGQRSPMRWPTSIRWVCGSRMESRMESP